MTLDALLGDVVSVRILWAEVDAQSVQIREVATGGAVPHAGAVTRQAEVMARLADLGLEQLQGNMIRL